MKLAFSTLGCPSWTLDQIIKSAVAYGYDGVEIRGLLEHVDLRQSPAFTPGQRPDTRRRFEDAGLAICCASASASFANGANRAAAMDEAKAYIDIAADLGCPVVRVFGGSPGEGESDEAGMHNLVTSLSELAPIAADRAVTLVLETHDAFSTGARVAAALRQVNHPAIRALWDLHHPYRHGESAETTYRELEPFIRHTHVKDSVEGGQYCLLGQGDIPLEEMVNLLKTDGIGDDVYICLEWEKRWHPDIAEPEVAFPQYAAGLRNLLNED